MPKQREVYHVVHESDANAWKVEKEGSLRAITRTETKEPAVSAAKKLAKSASLGQVIIHRKDGSIQEEFTYGEDPRDTPG